MMKYSRFSYRRLKQEVTLPDEHDILHAEEEEEAAIRRRRLALQQKVEIPIFSNTAAGQQQQPTRGRRRWRLRISGLKRFFSSSSSSTKTNRERRRRRRRPRVRMIWAKVIQRLKESREHFGELFAGNYLFMQVAPDYPFNNSNSKTYLQYYSSHQNKFAPPPPLPFPTTTTTTTTPNNTSRVYYL